MIYTIGPNNVYRASMEVWGPQSKTGRHDDYKGGCAFVNIDDAFRYIREVCDDDPKFGVFGLDATWQADTEPSEDQWWHYLLVDRPIVLVDDELAAYHLN